jgi:hypothetical protein
MRKQVKAKWENTKKMVPKVVGYEERKKRNGWYDEECQVKMEEKIEPE